MLLALRAGGFHSRHAGFIKRNGVVHAVLLRKLLVDNERHGLHFAFLVLVFAFVNAQPEHELTFSASANFYFADADNGVPTLCTKKFAQS